MSVQTAVGITASRHGLEPAQAAELTTWLTVLRRIGAATFHHGDCVGGDEQGAQIACQLGYRIVGHPPADDRLRAHFPSDDILPALPYHDRNKNIVSRSDVLFACPAESVEQPRGGTWWTIRYARQVNEMFAEPVKRPIIILGPDGRIVR